MFVRTVVVFALALLATTANAQSGQPGYTCPLDGAQTQALGSAGKPAPRTYSDFEVPTTAYTSYVVACPKCGWAAWTQEFERAPSPDVAGFVRSQLGATAKRASSDAVFAYQHLIRVLEYRGAPRSQRISALLFYSYVLKRDRPAGGQDHELERRIKGVRQDVLALLERAIVEEAPRTNRAKLEWQYLIGELNRLTGAPKKAAPLLQSVCAQSREAGYMVGKAACEMATRAERGETFEDYRDGVFDVAAVPLPGAKPPVPAADAKPQEAKPAAPPPEPPPPPMARQPAPRPVPDAITPPPPPTVTAP
jgi:hypothetical protein